MGCGGTIQLTGSGAGETGAGRSAPRIRRTWVAELHAENEDVTVVTTVRQVRADKLVDHIGGLA